MESGLLLAVVERGAELGAASAEDGDRVPQGARRKAGVSVRVTYMYYGLAGDGAISAERTRRFAKQANFRRRELGLPHGSLVTGLGSWGGPENAPIKLFGFRLTDANEGRKVLGVIKGVNEVPVPTSLGQACASLKGVVSGVESAVHTAEQASNALGRKGRTGSASQKHLAAIYLYTMAHSFYRQLNAAMRDEDRAKAVPFFAYLKLLFSGLEALAEENRSCPAQASVAHLWRGVNLDLQGEHVVGNEVVWWGASSCTPNLSVARGFLGSTGARTLFGVRHHSAVPIKEYSAFRGEEEWLLAPGTRLRVESVVPKSDGCTEITLTELPPPRAVH